MTKIVDLVKLEDFSRISVVVPPDAVDAVRVGTSCRVNGAPLIVASVRGGRGEPLVASFGVALNSPLTATLPALRPSADVRFEVEDAADGSELDVMDAVTSKQMREMQDGLPGTRQWYSDTLPWYTKMYPSRDTEYADRTRTSDLRPSAAPPSYANGIADVGARGFPPKRDGAEAERADDSAESASDVHRAYYDVTAPAPAPADDDEEDGDAGAWAPPPAPSFGTSSGADGASSAAPPAASHRPPSAPPPSSAALAPADPLGAAGREVMGALEKLARRNSHLTDRVEALLDMIEERGFGDAEVMDGLKRLESSGSAAGEGAEEETEEELWEKGSGAAPEIPGAATDSSRDEDGLGADTVREPVVEVCATTHPGALCCTRTEVAMDPTKGAATITLHTTVRAVDRSGRELAKKMSPRDYVALGARVIKEKAEELASAKTDAAVRGDTTKEQEEAHLEITKLLQNGKIVWVDAMSEIEGKFGHPCYRLKIECNKGSGKTVDCVFKPAIEGNGDGWHRASMEYVAYKLSRMLGMDLVPPAAYRTGGIELDYKKFDEGAFMYWVDGADELEKTGDFRTASETGCWGEGVDPRVVLSDTRVLDVLLHNSDRHSGHFLFGRHWTEGGPRNAADEGAGAGGVGNEHGPDGKKRFAPTLGGSHYRPVLIDHAASFRPEAFVSMEHENAFQTGPTVVVKSTTYLRLRFLDAAVVKREFGYFLSDDEQKLLLQRRDTILEYLDNLVEERGYDEVVIH